MNKEVLSYIDQQRRLDKKMLAVLVDPDKCDNSHLKHLITLLKQHTPDFIFLGGSQLRIPFVNLVEYFKSELTTPVILFPGDVTQFTPNADGILFLSLISGRNPEYLISQHVKAAIPIHESGLEVIPTGYILLEGGRKSAVEYISNTQPIPRDKYEITLSTALAGQLLGMQTIYIEAGSGAQIPVPCDLIHLLKKQLNVPLIVGGGIKTKEQLAAIYKAGADIVVIGNALENNPLLIKDFMETRDKSF